MNAPRPPSPPHPPHPPLPPPPANAADSGAAAMRDGVKRRHLSVGVGSGGGDDDDGDDGGGGGGAPVRSSSAPLIEHAALLKKKAGRFIQGLVSEWNARSVASLGNADGAAEGTHRREKRLSDGLKRWKRALPRWSSLSQRARTSLCWSGIPPSMRGQAWKTIIGNELKITPELYHILAARAVEASSASSPTSSSMSESREHSASIIEVDIPRTFPHLKIFHGDGPLYKPLLSILRTYVSFRPDIGYIQGMSYIAAILLLNLDCEVDAFIALANLFNRQLYFSLFRDFSSGKVPLKVFERLLHRYEPKVASHFESMGIEPSMYLYDWILTMFSRSFPLDVACRIWDNFLVSGSVFLFKASLGIIKLYSKALLQSSFEQCLNLLNHVPENINLVVDEYFHCIHAISITSKQFEAELDKQKTATEAEQSSDEIQMQ